MRPEKAMPGGGGANTGQEENEIIDNIHTRNADLSQALYPLSLDALHPKQLQELVRDSIRAFTDLGAVACNAAIENREYQFLNGLKMDVHQYVDKKLRQATTFEGGAI